MLGLRPKKRILPRERKRRIPEKRKNVDRRFTRDIEGGQKIFEILPKKEEKFNIFSLFVFFNVFEEKIHLFLFLLSRKKTRKRGKRY